MAASTHDEEEQYSQSSGGSDSDFGSDEDPNYNILEETQSRLSSLSMKKKSISRIGKGTDAGEKKVDEKSFEKVQEIIAAGEIGKLKVEQCKVYLRKNGLRLSGNKETLIQRVKEHQEILNGEGEDKYPVSSFVISCKGDACTGDVVMFEQNVYEMFNIASRSASGPPSGTRVVAGRIVKESYGAAKQQHTFTIEVLWSKGEKALPPLHPLLIKGRNLYRLTTLRQKWEYEGERQKILMEKHLRGSLARSNREIRIQEKEKRKMLRETRAVKRQESDRSQTNPTLIGNMGMHAQQGSCSDLRKMAIGTQKISILSHKAEANPRGKIGPKATCSQHSGSSAAAVNVVSGPLKAAQHSGLSTVGVKTERSQQAAFPLQESERTMVASKFFNGHDKQQQIRTRNADSIKPTNYIPLESSLSAVSRRQVLSRNSFQQHTSDTFGAMSSNSYRDDPFSHFNKYSGTRLHGGTWEENHHREPLTSINQQRSPTLWQSSRSVNHPAPMRLQHRHHNQLCKYYPQGRCYYGDNCKFSHDWER